MKSVKYDVLSAVKALNAPLRGSLDNVRTTSQNTQRQDIKDSIKNAIINAINNAPGIVDATVQAIFVTKNLEDLTEDDKRIIEIVIESISDCNVIKQIASKLQTAIDGVSNAQNYFSIAYDMVHDQLLEMSVCNKLGWGNVEGILTTFVGLDIKSEEIINNKLLTIDESRLVRRFRDRFFGHVVKHFASKNLLTASVDSSKKTSEEQELIPLDQASTILAQDVHSFCIYDGIASDNLGQAMELTQNIMQKLIDQKKQDIKLTVDQDGVVLSKKEADNYTFKVEKDLLNLPSKTNPAQQLEMKVYRANFNQNMIGEISNETVIGARTSAIKDACEIEYELNQATQAKMINLFFRLFIPFSQPISGREQLGSFFVKA